MVLLHKKIDWTDYRSFEEAELQRIFANLKLYLEKKINKPFSSTFLFSIFYYPLSDIIFEHYLMRQGLKEELKSPRVKLLNILKKRRALTSCIKKISELSSDDQVVEYLFFHRHWEFKKMFTGLISSKSKLSSGYLPWGPRSIKAMELILGSEYPRSLILKNSFFPTLLEPKVHQAMSKINLPKVLFTNSHGLYSSPLMFLLIGYIKNTGGSIVINQPGLIHPHVKFFNQIQYESIISNRYLVWQSSLKTVGNVNFGSFYRWRDSVKLNNYLAFTLIVLPQRPKKCRAFSTYFIDTDGGGDQYLEKILIDIERNRSKFLLPPVLRCKECCFDFYKELLIKNRIDIKLECGDINQLGGEYGRYETIITTYLSTSIIESFDKAKNVFIVISDEDSDIVGELGMDLRSLSNFFTSFDKFDPSTYDQREFALFVNKYAVKISPEEAKKKITKLIMELK